MRRERVRNLILGGGAVGAATAYQLGRRGEPALLLEQFRIGHDRGSSHGLARITRHSYAEPYHARLMIEAFRGWRALEADAGVPLYVKTGGVSFGPPEVGYVASVAASLAEIGVPHRRMDGAELNRRLPAFGVPGGYDAVYEPDAGLLAASRAVRAQADLAGEAGVEIREDCPASRIDLEGERPAVLAGASMIEADHLIVAAGAWAGRLLPGLATTLRPTRQRVLYLRPEAASDFEIGRFPVWIYKGEADDDAFYGMPEFLGGGVKAARHAGPDVDPDETDATVDGEYVGVVRKFLARHIPGLAGAPLARAEVCLYTMAPDEHFVVGPWRGRADVLVASPCSGHGFKFSNLVGRALADLATTGTTDLDIGRWHPDRAESARAEA